MYKETITAGRKNVLISLNKLVNGNKTQTTANKILFMNSTDYKSHNFTSSF